MMECTRLSERMVAVAHGLAAWEPDEDRHLATCDDCRIEWAMVRATRRVGESVERGFPADRISAQVVATLRQPAPRVLRFPSWRWVAIPAAAAVLAFLLVRGPVRTPVPPTPSAVAAESSVLLPEIESLDASGLESVLQLLPVTTGEVEDIHGYNDMTEDELNAVLQSLEG